MNHHSQSGLAATSSAMDSMSHILMAAQQQPWWVWALVVAVIAGWIVTQGTRRARI